MPVGHVRTYSDAQQMESAYTAAQVQITPTARMPFYARVVRVELENLWLQAVHERAPRIKHAAQSSSRAFFKFLARPGPGLMADGMTLPFGRILRHSQAHCYYDRSTDAVDWASVSLPVDQLQVAGTSMIGSDLLPPRNPAVIAPPWHQIARLRELHGQAATLAENSPEVLATPEVARGLEQALVHSLVRCLDTAAPSDLTYSQRSHQMVMRRFQRLLDANPRQPLYVPEVCAEIGVPERTLRLCCQEHLGMSPKQFLLLRRMHLARRALRSAMVTEVTVTEIASGFGFWHFGRFAGYYRSLFGEPPSVTLYRATGRG